MKEAYVSFETAKLLKEKGFKESTQFVWYEHFPSPNAVHNSEIGKPKRDYFYWEKEGERNSPWTNNSPIPSYISGEVYSCPTHQTACAWLRERGYHISILYQGKYKTWGRIIQELSTGIEWSIGGFDSHDRAVENAIIYTLENLI